jgi:hypothetical protein
MTADRIHKDLRAAWRAHLLTVTGLPSAWAWEARAFTPVIGTPWTREAFRPITSKPRALGTGGTIAHRCTGNLSLFFPSGNGTTAIDDAAGQILAAFKPGTPLVYGIAKGTVLEAERAGLITEPDWVSCPVIITITAYSVN